jgi:hypothetical protein
MLANIMTTWAFFPFLLVLDKWKQWMLPVKLLFGQVALHVLGRSVFHFMAKEDFLCQLRQPTAVPDWDENVTAPESSWMTYGTGLNPGAVFSPSEYE